MARLLLEAENLRKSFGMKEVLDLDHLTVYDGEKIGLIGENGMGKSSLLRMLSGELTPDEGTIRCLGSSAFIRQQGNAEEEAGNGRDAGDGTPEGSIAGAETEYEGDVWHEKEPDRQTWALFRAKGLREGLSGGEMTRRRIAAALSAHPQLLLADEPTTDLDGEGLTLLRKQLQAFPGAMILVSHDRTLLRQLCNQIWYLEDGKLTVFPGGYDAFMAERTRQRERQQFEYDQYQSEQKRLKESAQKMAEKATSVRKAPSRMGNSEARLHKREWTDAVIQISHAKRTLQNRMEHLEAKERPRDLPDIRMKLGSQTPVEAKTVLKARCDRLSVGKNMLLGPTELILPTGSKTALIGGNGVGKSSLLRVLNGESEPPVRFAGSVQFNPAVRIGWFDQHHEKTLDLSKTVLENVLAVSVHPESLVRTVLIRLNFKREEIFKPVSVLSGGERAKTALARLLLTDCNLLILDEPTNHLDLFTLEELERLLSDYGGTVLFVSHDEEFIRKTATRIVRFEGKKLIPFEGTMDEMRRDAKKDVSREELRLAISALEMRMAALSARMAAPKKGEHPDQMQAEYLEMGAKLREMKKACTS